MDFDLSKPQKLLKETARQFLARERSWAEMADQGRVCLVANARSDDLSFVSVADRKELLRLPIGNGPKHITVARLPAPIVAAVKSAAPR